jgi:hypothetical protein
MTDYADLCRALERYPYTDPFTPEQACSVAARAIEALQKEVEELRARQDDPELSRLLGCDRYCI